MIHKEWYSRGYLPHFDHPGLIQMITYRLADALPAAVLLRLKAEAKDDSEKRRRLEAYLDAGHGSCSLRDPKIARIVEDAFLHFDGQWYKLLEWVVMPNHVHVLVEIDPQHRLSTVVTRGNLLQLRKQSRYSAPRVILAAGLFRSLHSQ